MITRFKQFFTKFRDHETIVKTSVRISKPSEVESKYNNYLVKSPIYSVPRSINRPKSSCRTAIIHYYRIMCSV